MTWWQNQSDVSCGSKEICFLLRTAHPSLGARESDAQGGEVVVTENHGKQRAPRDWMMRLVGFLFLLSSIRALHTPNHP